MFVMSILFILLAAQPFINSRLNLRRQNMSAKSAPIFLNLTLVILQIIDVSFAVGGAEKNFSLRKCN